MSDAERWLPVPGWEGLYDVSDRGRVRSMRGPGGATRPMKSFLDQTGYYRVNLTRPGARDQVRVHRLVLLAFRPTDRAECSRHLDGNRRNNMLSNLAWGSQQQNMRDMVLHGTSNRGERNARAKLTEGQVAEIRRRHAAGDSIRRVASLFAVHRTTVFRVVVGRTWGPPELSAKDHPRATVRSGESTQRES